MQKTKKHSIVALVECAIMIALSTVLSIVKIIDLPCGGSVTVASMLPIVIAVYRHGAMYGFGVCLVNSTIQLLFGLNNLSYAVNWQAAVAIILFDYIIPFSVFALSAVFKKKIKNQASAVTLGVILSSLLRYLCHTIVGCTVWAGISIPTGAAIAYSLSYNATYMLPETLILSLVTAYIFGELDFSLKTPRRIRGDRVDSTSSYLLLSAGLSLLIGIIVDIVLVFSKLQNEESGELDFGGLANVNYTALIIVTVVSILIFITLYLFVRQRDRKKA